MTRARTAEEQANLSLVETVYEQVLKPLDPDRVGDFFAPGYVQHNPMAESGADGLKRFLAWARETSPGATHDVKRLFVDGDHVIGHVHVVINPGERGNAVIDIFRIENGRIAEHWDAAQAVPDLLPHGNSMF